MFAQGFFLTALNCLRFVVDDHVSFVTELFDVLAEEAPTKANGTGIFRAIALCPRLFASAKFVQRALAFARGLVRERERLRNRFSFAIPLATIFRYSCRREL